MRTAADLIKIKYDFSKSDENLFGIDIIYREMPRHSFLVGRKQELLTLLVYYGVGREHSEESNAFWEKYLSRIKYDLCPMGRGD